MTATTPSGISEGSVWLQPEQHASTTPAQGACRASRTRCAAELLRHADVSTTMARESGVPDVQRFVAARQGRSLIHFGASASHHAARLLAWGLPLPVSAGGPEAGLPPPRPSTVTNDAASSDRLKRILQSLRAQLDAGAAGIGMLLGYMPGTTRHEVIEELLGHANVSTTMISLLVLNREALGIQPRGPLVSDDRSGPGLLWRCGRI